MTRLISWIFLTAVVVQAQVTVDPVPPIIVDQNGTGTATIVLRSEAKPKLQLGVDQWRRVFGKTAYPVPVIATFEAIDPDHKSAVDGTGPMPSVLAVKLTVTGVVEAGETTASLTTGGEKIPGGTLNAVRVPVAYNVHLEDNGAPKPEVIRGPSHASTVRITNADPSPYQFKWRVRIHGDERPATDTNDVVSVPANGSVTLDVSSGIPFPDWLNAGTLKDRLVSAELVLYPFFDGAPVPPQKPLILPLSIKLRYWWDGVQEAFNLFFLFGLLCVGGMTAIWVYCGMPNTTRALAVRKRLRAAKAKINGLCSGIDSRWRVLLVCHRENLKAKLASTMWVFPSFSGVLDDVEKELEMFEGWVQSAYDVSLVLDAAQQQRAHMMPPTVMRWIGSLCDQALNPIESSFTTSEEVQVMRSTCARAKALLSGVISGTVLPDLETAIQAREADAETHRVDLVSAFPEFTRLITEVADAPDNIVPASYRERDTLSRKVELLNEVRRIEARYARARAQAATGDGGTGSSTESVNERLMLVRQNIAFMCQFLQADSQENLEAAERIRQQIGEEVYNETLRDEFMKDPLPLSIAVRPYPVKLNTLIRMTVEFRTSSLATSASSSVYKCCWNFDHESSSEGGWIVYHSYRQRGRYNVTATISSMETGKKVAEVSRELLVEVDVDEANAYDDAREQDAKGTIDAKETVNRLVATAVRKVRRQSKQSQNWFSPETVLEAARLALVLLTAVVGLLTTAQQQIQALTLLQASGLAMGLGFGAGTLKNLISEKPS